MLTEVSSGSDRVLLFSVETGSSFAFTAVTPEGSGVSGVVRSPTVSCPFTDIRSTVVRELEMFCASEGNERAEEEPFTDCAGC